MKRTVSLLLIFSILSSVSISCKTNVSQPKQVKRAQEDIDTDAAIDIYNSSSSEEAIAKARKFVIGTWTCIVPGSREYGSYTICYKLIIREDGTGDEFIVPITNDDWGKAYRTGKWKIVKDKDIVTGESYYKFRFVNLGDFGNTILNSGKLQIYKNEVYSRGDQSPFSK